MASRTILQIQINVKYLFFGYFADSNAIQEHVKTYVCHFVDCMHSVCKKESPIIPVVLCSIV